MSAAFPASRIARTLGWDKRRVLSALALVAPDEKTLVSGNRTSAWKVTSLPPPLLEELKRVSTNKGYKSEEELLASPEKRWSPPVPLSQIPEADLAYAEKLQSVLVPLAQAQSDYLADFSEEESKAADRYRRAFRISGITPRHIKNLLSLVLDRDRGFEEWGRLEIFLPGKYSKASNHSDRSKEFEQMPEETPLAQVLRLYGNERTFTTASRSAIWQAAVETFLFLEQLDWKPQTAKKAIRAMILDGAPGFCESAESCKRLINQKITLANKEGLEAVKDGRERSGNFRRPDFSEDRLQLIAVANAHQGNIGLAHRLLYRSEGWRDPKTGKLHQFSQAYRDYISLNLAKNKSYVPHFMRASVRGPVKAIKPLRIGPKAARLATPSRFRDWSDSLPNDYHTSDDETANSFVYFPSEEGKYECEWGRFDVGRPQILPLIDQRTTLYLALELSFTPGYSSETIKQLLFGAWKNEAIGMPNIGLLFEQGIWKSHQVAAMADLQKLDPALAKYGRKIRHATTPRAKIIERVFGSEQARTDALPGYVGRGKGDPRRERLDAFLAGLKRHGQPRKEAVDPREKLLSLRAYRDHLLKILEEYNNEPQNGQMLRGLSPQQAWAEGRAGRPAEVLPSSLEWLMTTKEKLMKVSPDGITFDIAGKAFQFCADKNLGLLIGERVLVRYNSSNPDYVLYTHPATDPQGKNPRLVPVRQMLPATTATEDDFRRAREEERVFTAGQRQLFSIVVPNYNLTRLANSDLPTHIKEAGQAVAEAKQAHAEEQRKEKKAAPKARELGQRHRLDTTGVGAETAVRNLTAAEGLRAEIEQMEEIEEALTFLASPQLKVNP